jgi:hypothetical protein
VTLKQLSLLVVCALQDALVLLGPFVDVEHAAVSSGSLDFTFEELFAAQVGNGCRLGFWCRRRAHLGLAEVSGFKSG